MSVASFALAQDQAAAPAAAPEAVPAAAADNAAPQTEAVAAPVNNMYKQFAPIGCGIIIFGAGFGIGKIGGSAVESMARQPEAAGAIQTAMILAAALVEGATLFALVICLIL
ncbi:MAG: ATP synthase F0 subunit C [Thermoguttaceae bacterium]|nr:ATP synthase F0 subunit C [Thermoguttaceae bacterium]MBP3693467.1 ATP synthase F0 subunit C [Thermoguttaceae bacterium]